MRALFLSCLLACLVISVFAAAAPASAQVIDCDTEPALQGNTRRGPAGTTAEADRGPDENCLLWDGSTPDLSIYRPVHARTSEAAAEASVELVKSAVETALRVYRENGFLAARRQPPVRVWIVQSPGPRADADANSSSATSPCVVHLFAAYLREDFSEGYLRQVVAHELFHCVQFAQLGQPYAPATYWWMEGSAEWASALVVPEENAEFDSTSHYHQHEILFDQCDPDHFNNCGESTGIYATALFFQDMANQKGAGAVFHLLRSMPNTDDPVPQYRTFSDYPGIDEIFQVFAQHYMDQMIADLGGGYMDQPEPIYSETFTIDDDTDMTIQGTPLVIYAYQFNFAKGKAYEIDGLHNDDRFRFSFHMGDTLWRDGDQPDPVRVDPGCDAMTGVVVITSAEDIPDIRDFDVQVRVVDEHTCSSCTCASPVPACVTGKWKSSDPLQWRMFLTALRQKTDFTIGGTGAPGNSARISTPQGDAATVYIDDARLNLDVADDGDFNSSTLINYHGEGEVDGTPMRVDSQINNAAHGHVCLTSENLLCAQYTGATGPTEMTVTAAGYPPMSMVSPGHGYEGQFALPYTCSANSLTFTVPVPLDPPFDELPLEFHR